MPDFSVAVLADQAIVDRSGKLSLIGIFRNLGLRNIPSVFPKFTVAIVMSQVDKPIKVQVEVHDLKANRSVVKLPVARVAPPNQGNDVQLVLELSQVPFKTFGKHEVRIIVNGEVARFIPFSVQQAAVPSQAKPKAQ